MLQTQRSDRNTRQNNLQFLHGTATELFNYMIPVKTSSPVAFVTKTYEGRSRPRVMMILVYISTIICFLVPCVFLMLQSTALHYAAQYGDNGVVEHLVEKGALVNCKDENDVCTVCD